MTQHDSLGLYVDDGLALSEDDADQEPRLVIPSGILDADMWRGRILTVLTAAGREGMTSTEVEEALAETWAIAIAYRRVKRWLAEAVTAGTVVCDADEFFYAAAFAASGVQDAAMAIGDQS